MPPLGDPTEAERCVWRRPMRSRDPTEPHRGTTPLELLFDLCFTVAVAQASAHLHHGIARGHAGHALGSFALVFFAIWWAWMNFTWFASAYDTDDALYRVTVLAQIAGVLVLAAGVPSAFDALDFTVMTLGYVAMRVCLVAQWLRAAHDDAPRRRTARRYALGISVCQLGWLALLALPSHWRLLGWLVMAPAELLVPVWAERAGRTAWHPRHIADRYGCFTLIVLGESILAGTLAIQAALDARASLLPWLGVVGGGLAIVSAMWWVYFDEPAHERLKASRTAFRWGYGHLPIFAAAAAVGAGLSVAADQAAGVVPMSAREAGAAVAVPVAVFLVATWLVHARPRRRDRLEALALPLTAALALATCAVPGTVLWTGVLLALLVAVRTARAPRDPA